MQAVMNLIMTGEATQSQVGGFLVGLRMKGETVDEITGAVVAMRALATGVQAKGNHVIDTCGMGGDSSGIFNISTGSAFIAAVGAKLQNTVIVIIKAVLLSALVALVLASGDKIIGSWVTPDDKAVVEIYQQDGKYFGKFMSLKEPLYLVGDRGGSDGQVKVDRNNPDATKHTQPIIGLVMLNGMEYAGQKKGQHKRQGGTIYDSGNGKT
jgi:uncharacterized protein (DUF2147 family)